MEHMHLNLLKNECSLHLQWKTLNQEKLSSVGFQFPPIFTCWNTFSLLISLQALWVCRFWSSIECEMSHSPLPMVHLLHASIKLAWSSSQFSALINSGPNYAYTNCGNRSRFYLLWEKTGDIHVGISSEQKILTLCNPSVIKVLEACLLQSLLLGGSSP